MAYTPNNVAVYSAAFAGALAGMGVSGRELVLNAAADYQGLMNTAGAFAEAFDTDWGLTPTTTLDEQTIMANCMGAWQERSPVQSGAFVDPVVYAPLANRIAEVCLAAKTYFLSEGITPVPYPVNGASTLIWGNGSMQTTAGISFASPGFQNNVTPTTTQEFRISGDRTLRRLRFHSRTSAGTPTANPFSNTIVVNGVNSLLSFSMLPSAVDGSDLVNQIDVNDGDLIGLSVNRSGSIGVGSQSNILWTVDAVMR